MIYKPSKLFPCDCMGEGLTVSLFWDEEDISEGEVKVSEDIWMRRCNESPFIQLSFWEFGICKKPRWNWWWRLKIAWHVFRDGSAWPDQVIMKAPHAKNLANHILYIVAKAQKEMKMAEKQPPLVKDESMWSPKLQQDINSLQEQGKKLVEKVKGDINRYILLDDLKVPNVSSM